MSSANGELNRVADMWSRRPVDLYSGYYLVLGATFDEPKRHRTHYNNPRVYLLDHKEPPNENENARFIHADFNSEHAGELRKVANTYANRFDEIAFDESTMCGFISEDSQNTLKKRIESFSIMLKQNGVLFFSESSSDIIYACQRSGLETMQIRLGDLHRDNLPIMLKFSGMEVGRVILLGIKTGKKGNINRGGGRRSRGSRSRDSRNRKLRSRKLRSRKLRKTARR